MPAIEIQTAKPISTAQKSPTISQPPSQQSSRQPSPTKTTAAKNPLSPTTLAPPPSTSSSAANRYAPASTTSTAPSYAPPQPGAGYAATPTGQPLPPPPRSPTRTINPNTSITGTTPPPPQPGAVPFPGVSTAQGLLSAQPGYNPPPPMPGLAPSISHPPGYHQTPIQESHPNGHPVAAANTSMGMGSLTPLSRSNTSSPVPPLGSPRHKRNMSGAGLPDPGSGGMLDDYLPEGTAESAGQYWSSLKGWVGSTASSVGKKAAEVEGSVWKRVNGE